MNGGSGPTQTSDTEAPSLSITSPKDGDSFYTSKTISASASANDNVAVTNVNFYLNGVLKCDDSSAPYNCSIPAPSSTGSATIMAKAFDAAGNMTTRTIGVSIVNDPSVDYEAPTVKITSPSEGAAYEVGSTVTVNVAATDNVGVNIVQVWHENYWHTATKTSSGYTYSFKMTESSTLIRALAKDDTNNMGLSDQSGLNAKDGHSNRYHCPFSVPHLSQQWGRDKGWRGLLSRPALQTTWECAKSTFMWAAYSKM